MNVPISWWGFALLAVALAAVLPLAGAWWRGGVPPGCALDGAAISPRQRVEFHMRDGTVYPFCSLTCAELWLSASPRRPDRILVTDEPSGELLPAGEAHYVRSRVMSSPTVRESRHVFRSLEKAQAHARQFQGRVLDAKQRPFEGNVAHD